MELVHCGAGVGGGGTRGGVIGEVTHVERMV